MDPWTLIGQLVNFLIFVAVLYYLLYRPAGSMMRQRREEMEASLEEARKKETEARNLRQDVEAREKKLEEERDSVLQRAREQAEADREKLLDEAEQEARKQMERYRAALQRERRETLEEMVESIGAIATAAARRVLEDCGEGGPNDAAVERVKRLLDDADAEELRRARDQMQGDPDEAVQVRAASPPTDSQRKTLRKALAEALELDDVAISVETDPDLLAGMEVDLGPLQIQAHWRERLREAVEAERQRLGEEDDGGGSDGGREDG